MNTPHSRFDKPVIREFERSLRADFEAAISPFIELCTPEENVDHIRRWLRNILMKAQPEAAARLLECMYDIDLRPRLSEIPIPTLIIHGDADMLPSTQLRYAEEAARLIPGSKLEIIKGAGHVPTLTRPQVVAQAISDFLDEFQESRTADG